MKKIFRFYSIPFLILGLTMGCEDGFEDAVPKSFLTLQANPDDIYLYNSNDPSFLGVRLDPLVNALHPHIRVTAETQELINYAHVIAANWNPPDEHVLRYFSAAANIF